jgi:hypothetical protein
MLVAALLAVSIAPLVRAELSAEQVSRAIERGVGYLKREQGRNGAWSDHPGVPGGVTALCTLAMLNCGVPVDDPAVKKALTYLRKLKPDKTYAVALQTMVFCAAEPKKDLVLIRRNANWLEQVQLRKGDVSGAWAYPEGPGDNSNSQFALLALHEAERVGVDVNQATWQKAYDYWKSCQRPEGSWGYTRGGTGTGSMTCAGIAALVITSGKVTSRDANVEGGRVQCCGNQQEEDRIEQGLDWLGRNFSVERNPGPLNRSQSWVLYYLYGVERVGRLTARRFIGKHDWYREGAEQLIARQDKLSGFWAGTGHAENHPHVGTPLALLFLSKGRRPVVVAKLKHGPDGDWNNHRHDLANLTAYTEKKWDRDLTWQVIDPQAASVDDLLQSPVLFINGSQPPQFTPAEIKNLREYIDQGGFIFAEACCGDDGFDRGFRELMEQVFEEPEYRLQLLPPSHPIWHAEQRVNPKYVRPLYGIEYGCRTSVVYCPEDLSCYWELGEGPRDAKWPDVVRYQIAAAQAIGVNVLTYATGREPRYKDDIPVETKSDAAEEGVRGTLRIAKLKHGGGCDAAPAALANLLRASDRELGMRVSARARQIAITDEDLYKHHLVFMHGRHKFTLSVAERKALAEFIERGGTLFADAICASPEFAESFRKEMKRILPDAPLEPIPGGDEMFTDHYGGYDIRTVTRRDPSSAGAQAPLQARLRKVEPALEGIRVGERYAVIFSPYDISCALEKHESLQCNGYIREDAERIGINVLLYSLHR